MSEVDTNPDVEANGEYAHKKKKKTRETGDLKPCDKCRSQHLKCVYDTGKSHCQRCERSGHACERSTKKIKFRDVPASRFHKGRKRSSVAEKTGSKTFSFVDESLNHAVDIKNDATVAAKSFSEPAMKDGSAQHSTTPHEEPTRNSLLTEHGMGTLPLQNVDLRQSSTTFDPSPGFVAGSTEDNFTMNSIHDEQDLALSKVFSADRVSSWSFGNSPHRRVAQSRCLDNLVKNPTAYAGDTPHRYLETVLLRFFHEELAGWFDLCDPDCHFAFVVPRRARDPGPLRSALLTISARHLSRNHNFRNEAGIVQWKGRLLPELKEEFAMPYQNDCIKDLLQLSLDPKKLQDETLLAAVIILRTDEELALNMLEEEEDQQLFLRIGSMFVDAQLPASLALPHSSPEVFHPVFEDDTMNQPITTSPATTANYTDPDLDASGLRQACFWTAFRQDLHAAFLHRRAVRFPLSRCEAFRQLTPATDAVWTNRMVTFCGDTLEFVFGSDTVDGKVLPAYTNAERWRELRAHEAQLCAWLPASFEPTYCNEPDTLRGEVFPEIWYLESCHVAGTTYVELARMLLEVFNPTRPRLGYGFLAATNAFISATKKILFRLCGIAMSNRHCPPSLINACLAISMFGEYFEDPTEQDALLQVLGLMAHRHAYPTVQIANSLQRAWNREDMTVDTACMTGINHIDTG